MKAQFLGCILSIIPSAIFAQYDNIYEQIAKTVLDGDYSKCTFIFNSVYKPENKIETEKSMNVLLWGTAANYGMSLSNPSYRPMAKELLGRCFSILEEKEKSFNSNITSVRQLLVQNSEIIGNLCNISILHADVSDNIIVEYADKFDHLIWEKRFSLDLNIEEDAITYLNISKIKATMLGYQNQTHLVHSIVLPEVFGIIRTSNNVDVRRTAFVQLKTIDSMINSLIQVGFTESLAYRFEYCYNIDRLSEIILKEAPYSKEYEKIGLESISDIRNLLNDDECVIYVYNLDQLISTSTVYGWIGLSKTLSTPVQGDFSDNASSIRESILETIPGKSKYIIIPLTSSCDLDIAGTDARFYMKFSITDHIKGKHISIYGGKDVEYIGDFDFGKGNIIENLSNEDKEYFTQKWNGKFLDNSSSKFSLNYLSVPPKRIEIIHISTHGVEEKKVFSGESYIYGDLNTVCLALPKYNENPQTNIIRGFEISKCNLDSISIAFLSLCDSAKSRKANGLFQISGSLAKAFYKAGVHNIIGYTKKIEDRIATEFTKLFYEKLRNNPSNTSIHDIFYNTKKEVNLVYNQDIGIFLWE